MDIDHADHYGRGFANFNNAAGDVIEFDVSQCTAGRHLLEFTYSLNDATPRPVEVWINGAKSPLTPVADMPDLGSWEEWGTFRMRADLVSGHNTVALKTNGHNGPNIDMLEVFPNGDRRMGHFHGAFDNAGSFYVNNQHILGPANTAWDKTTTATFVEECNVPTVYSLHVTDGEVSEAGQQGVGGVIATIQHCNELIVTGKHWKCIATDIPAGAAPDAAWNALAFKDDAWEPASMYGHPSDPSNAWNAATDDSYTPPDVAESAQWIWTSDAEGRPGL